MQKYERRPIQTAKAAGRDLKFDLSDLFANLQSVCKINIRHRRITNLIQEYEIAFRKGFEKSLEISLSEAPVPKLLSNSFLNT